MATQSMRRAALLAGGSLVFIMSQLACARADEALPEVDISATRTEQPLSQSASAITVISKQEV